MKRLAPYIPEIKNVNLASRVNFVNMLNKEYIPNWDDDFADNTEKTDRSFEREYLKEFN